MPRIEDWTLSGAQGQTIYGTTHLPDAEPTGALMICHGFKGYKDYGLLPGLARTAAAHGLAAHRFNFSHSGMTRNIESFERPDLFEKDTWSKQIQDLSTVASAARGGGLPGGGGLNQVWFGHSRGGVTVLLTARRMLNNDATPPATPPPDASDQPAGQTGRNAAQGLTSREQSLLKGVVTASAPDDAAHLSEDQKAMLRRTGRMASPSSRTGQTLYVGLAWLEEIEAQPEAFDPVSAAKAAAEAGCPMLILHGEADQTIPPTAARNLARAAGDQGRLEIIPGASHTFNAPNPLPLDEAPPPEATRMIEHTCRFAVERCEGP